MASRIFWFVVAGLALVGGIIMQDGGGIFRWGDHRTDVSTKAERTIEARVDRAIDHSFDKMQVVTSDGREIDVPAETKRALAEAVGRLVKAETDLAILRIRDGNDAEIEAANARRDRARADVETLKVRIERQKELSAVDRDAIGDQIREDVRETVREAVRN
jgi:hypothetical protein